MNQLRLLGLAMFTAGLCWAQTNGIEGDPFVQLYAERVELAKITALRQEAVLALASSRVVRAKASGPGVSPESLDILKTERDVSARELEFLRMRVREWESIHKIVRFLREQGKEVPLFPSDNLR